jgi:cytochrome c-type biogenesis protein CcmH
MNITLMLAAAAVVAAVTGWWVLRAYARADASKPKTPWALVWAAFAGATVLGLYVALGRPELPDQPYAQRLAAIEERAKSTPFVDLSPAEQLTLMAARAKETPADPRPHIVTGIILVGLERDEAAVGAFQAALRRDPKNTIAMVEMGRALTRIGGGQPPAEALALFQQASMLEPDNPIPWFYQALAASQENRFKDAQNLWPEVQTRLPKDDPRQIMAAQMLSMAKAEKPFGEGPTPK